MLPSAVYTEEISVDIFNTLSTCHLPSEVRKTLFFGYDSVASCPKSKRNKNLKEFSEPLDWYSGKTFFNKNDLSATESIGIKEPKVLKNWDSNSSIEESISETVFKFLSFYFLFYKII